MAVAALLQGQKKRAGGPLAFPPNSQKLYADAKLHRVVSGVLNDVRGILDDVRSVLDGFGGVIDDILDNSSVVGFFGGLLTASGQSQQASRSENNSDLLHIVGSQ